jgi:hypothetical protein
MKTKSEIVAEAFTAFCEKHGLETYIAAFQFDDGYRTIIHADYQEVFSMVHGVHVTLNRGMQEMQEDYLNALLEVSPIAGEA